jgi:hypothetical protein
MLKPLDSLENKMPVQNIIETFKKIVPNKLSQVLFYIKQHI